MLAPCRRYAIAAVLFTLAIAPASAHSDLHASEPPDGAVLRSSPGVIALSFSMPMQVMALRLINEAGREQPLRREGNRTALVHDARAAVTDALPAGDYRVEWRGASPDGHAGGGTVRFRIEPAR